MMELKPGKYRHFKGGEYELLYVAKHSETLEPMVVYRALYGEGSVWVRPAHMWSEIVEKKPTQVPDLSPSIKLFTHRGFTVGDFLSVTTL